MKFKFTTYTKEEVASLLSLGSTEKKSIDISSLHKELLEYKNKIPFFNDMSDEQIVSIISDVELSFCENGDVLFEKGKRTDRMFYIVEGLIELKTNIILGDLHSGELLADNEFFTRIPFMYSATVVQDDTQLISFKIDDAGLNNNNAVAFAIFYRNVTRLKAKEFLQSLEY